MAAPLLDDEFMKYWLKFAVAKRILILENQKYINEKDRTSS